MSLQADPFGRSALPPAFDREGRVRLIAQAAEALLAGRLPDAPARLFVGGALRAWLEAGGRCGSLEKDFLRVAAPYRSTLTASRLWQRECSTRRATNADALGSMEADATHERDDDDAD